MSYDRVQFAIQAHLAEFSALRQELLEMLKWRERLVFLSLGISGTLFSFAFSAEQHADATAMSRRLALYLVPPLASAIGALWLVNTWRIRRIGVYIRDELRPKLNQLLSTHPSDEHALAFEVFSWEGSAERLMHKWARRLCEWIVLLSAFVLAGVVAQFLIIFEKGGSLKQRLTQLDSPTMFFFNCLVLAASLLLFLHHLGVGRSLRASSALMPS